MRKEKIIVGMVLLMLIFPSVNADIIFPTMTKVYFEQNGQPYDGKIDFTIKGYGYVAGMPGSANFVDKPKEKGTYTPEVVFSFSATYNNYGDEIYEDYYQNYVHIDYYELEGKTADGKTFIIRNINSIPTNCIGVDPEENGEYQSCISELVEPNFIDPATQSAGATREDFRGTIWTKGGDGWWHSPNEQDTQWADVMWYEVDKEVYAYDEAKKKCEEILDNLYYSEDFYLRKCELRFNLDNADWSFTPPEPQGFWSKIGCFFKGLFGKGC